MEITFAPSFFKSFKKMINHDIWYNKVLDFFRYGIKRFIKNVYIFRRELYDFQPWDNSFNLQLLKKSLELTANHLEKYGYEEDISRNKKIEKIRRVVQLLDNEIDSNYIDQAEIILGMEVGPLTINHDGIIDTKDDENDKKIFELARKLEQDQWEELWQIIKGNNPYNTENGRIDDISTTPYDEWFDGSDMRSWWD